MTQSSKNKMYTASDIERYHAGQMTAAEMHALEKAAMEDPFLADALEGYAFTTNASEDLQKIRQRLEVKQASGRTVPLFFRHNNWMKAAAVLLLVAGGSFLIYNLADKQDKNIAVTPRNENPQNLSNEVKQAPQEQALKKDSAVNPDLAAEKPVNNTTEEVIVRAKENPITPLSGDIVYPDMYKKTESVPPPSIQVEMDKYSKDQASVPSRNNERVPNYNENYNRGIESFNMSRSMPDPNVSGNVAQNRQQANNRYITDNNLETARNNVVKLRGLTDDKRTDTIRNFDVVLKENKSEVAEVVVLSSGKEKTAARKQMVVVDTLEPAAGWTDFDEYVLSHIKMPDELVSRPVKDGAVQLEFDVDKDGRPVNITVVRSLCNECDEEAKRLLREGPKWKKKKNRKGKVTIRF